IATATTMRSSTFRALPMSPPVLVECREHICSLFGSTPDSIAGLETATLLSLEFCFLFGTDRFVVGARMAAAALHYDGDPANIGDVLQRIVVEYNQVREVAHL